MATTSSGRSRRPSLWLAGAVALAAVALFRLAEPDSRSAPLTDPGVVSDAGLPASPPAAPGAPARAPARPGVPLNDATVDAALEAAAPGNRDLVVERQLAAWLAEDPRGAARFSELLADPFLREVGLRTVALGWARADAEAAARWAESLADAPERDRAIEDVALTVADSDPGTALDLLGRRTESGADDARVGVVLSWARLDFAAASAWSAALPPGRSRDEIVQRLAWLRAPREPEQAIRLVDAMISDETKRRDAWVAIAPLWAAKDPEGIRAWAMAADAETRRRIDAQLALAATAAAN